MSLEENKSLVGSIVGKMKEKERLRMGVDEDNRDTAGMTALPDSKPAAEPEKREKREGVWVLEGKRKPNRLRNLLHKKIYTWVREGFGEHEAFEMFVRDSEVQGIIKSHYNRKCRTWSDEEWIDASKSRLRADGKAMLKRFGQLPPDFPATIMDRKSDEDTLASWMMAGGATKSELEERDTKKKKD